MTSTTFRLAELQELRKRAAKAREISKVVPEGWSKSMVDPMDILAAFQPLRIKDGFILRAYQFREGGDGKGCVWAMPVDAGFPDPERCPRAENALLGPPKPRDALDDAMEAITGDGSPWSYLCASLFCREFREVGAMWHGCDWNNHTILDQNPLQVGNALKLLKVPSGQPDQWTWLEPEPDEWRPLVSQDGDAVMVVFFTFSGVRQQTIHRHTDTFQQGSYLFKTQTKEIAVGPRGYVF